MVDFMISLSMKNLDAISVLIMLKIAAKTKNSINRVSLNTDYAISIYSM